MFQNLDPAAGRSLTNTAFSYSSVRGFNWRAGELAGVQIRAASNGLRIELTGEQPEHASCSNRSPPFSSAANTGSQSVPWRRNKARKRAFDGRSSARRRRPSLAPALPARPLLTSRRPTDAVSFARAFCMIASSELSASQPRSTFSPPNWSCCLEIRWLGRRHPGLTRRAHSLDGAIFQWPHRRSGFDRRCLLGALRTPPRRRHPSALDRSPAARMRCLGSPASNSTLDRLSIRNMEFRDRLACPRRDLLLAAYAGFSRRPPARAA